MWTYYSDFIKFSTSYKYFIIELEVINDMLYYVSNAKLDSSGGYDDQKIMSQKIIMFVGINVLGVL